jgi:hypothetical protein
MPIQDILFRVEGLDSSFALGCSCLLIDRFHTCLHAKLLGLDSFASESIDKVKLAESRPIESA